MDLGFSKEAFYLTFTISIIIISVIIHYVLSLISKNTNKSTSKRKKPHGNLRQHNEFYTNLESQSVAKETKDSSVVEKRSVKPKKEDRKEEVKAQNETEKEDLKARFQNKAEKQRLYEEKLKTKEEARILKEQQEIMAAEEKKRKAYEEYLKLKDSFIIEEEGASGSSEENKETVGLEEFVQFIKDKKIVEFDTIAFEFNMKTADVIDRIKHLISDNIIQGILDDRGKFIYVSDQDLISLLNYVNEKGKFSISDVSQFAGDIFSL